MGSIALQQDQKPYGYVYKITNLVNGKIYVGQTTQDVHTRFRQHCHSKSKMVIRRAIKKYGSENFAIEAVKECFSLEELGIEEERLIQKIGCIGKYGYNQRLGGLSSGKCSDELKKRYSEAHNHEKMPLLQYSLEGHFIARHLSTKDAAKAVGEDKSSNIVKAAKGFFQSANDSIWIYEGEEFLLSEKIQLCKIPKRGRRGRTVIQMDEEGNRIAKFFSTKEAGKSLEIRPLAISKACSGERKLAGGFRWSYEGGRPIEQPKLKGRVPANSKPVIITDANGVTREFPSASAAGRFLGRNQSYVSSAMSTGRKVDGHTFAFKERV